MRTTLALGKLPVVRHVRAGGVSWNDMDARARFAKWVFQAAGIYGVVVLLPQYFLEGKLGRDFPPPLTHPEHFYGFIGVALAWQVAFLIIARDPRRYRIFMIPCVLEKVTFGAAVLVLFAQGRVAAVAVGFGVLDLILASLFTVAYIVTGSPGESG